MRQFFSLATIVNNMLEAHRNGDLVSAAYWADMYDEVMYVL